MKAKKFLSLLMSLAMILTALPLSGVTAFAEDGTHTSGDFEYVVLEDGTAEITGYVGNSEVLDIPSKLDTYTVISIGNDAFADCDGLTSVTIPDSVTSIGDSAFHWCTNLTSIKIPESVKSIGKRTFYNCCDLTSVTIPNSVISIGEGAFLRCDSLTEIKVDASNKNFTSQEGVLFDKDITELIQYPIGNTRTSYDIPKGVTNIGGYAFDYCDLTSITIPESVTSIGDSAFSDCYYFTSIAIPESVTSIGEYAFSDSNLTSITIPNSVISIGEGAFYDCTSLTEINVNTNNKNYSSQDGVLFDENKTELIQYPAGNARDKYDIPNSVTSIGWGAFRDCDSLTSITIPDKVASIGEYMCSNCDSLTSITIGNGVTSIGGWAFENCESLTNITIGNSVTSIGYNAFANTGCYNSDSNWKNGVLYIDNCLIEVKDDEIPENYTINEGTKFIANDTFLGCENLTSVTIPDSVTIIGEYAFNSCTSLASITIGNSVTSIGEYAFSSTEYYNNDSNWENGVLYIDNYLISTIWFEVPKNYKINEGTRAIADRAFEFCSDLKSVTIPESVISIGNEAFYECYSLTDIYILNKDCNIVSSEDYYTIPTETTIHGYAGSTAESYAEEHGNKFDMICNHSNMKKVEAKAATCTEDGNIDYYHCPECNRNYEDINGNEEITDVVVKATGHKFENGVCTVCGEKEPVTPDKQNAIGDVDGNKKITITDAKWILQNTVKSRTFTEAQAKAADLNKDGKITIVDAKWVLQIVVGLRDAQTLKPIKK